MKNELRIALLLLCLSPLFLFGQGTLSALGDMHSVTKGETWESVAAAHSISVAQLHAANPDVKGKKLKKGSLLIVPKNEAQKAKSEEQETSTPEPQPSTPVRTSISDLKVGVLLPFSEGKMVEFYRGFLMAADSVRKGGVNLDIHAWDCGTTIAQTEQLLPELTGFDIIYGPSSATQIPAVAEVCRERGMRLVLPFWSGQPLSDYPLVYNATAPSSLVYEAAMKMMMTYYPDRNYIIVHSGTADLQGQLLSGTVTRSLAQRTNPARILELEGDDFVYESAFNQFRDNMIILDDSSIRSLNILMAHLKDFHKKHPQYRFSLVGYPEWQNDTQHLLSEFYAADTYFISTIYYNVLDIRTKRFQSSYEKLFHTPVTSGNPSYAALGFDLGFYTLSGISSLGDTFEQQQGTLRQEPYQNRFKFERGTSSMSFTNSFVQLIHYTPEEKIEFIR